MAGQSGVSANRDLADEKLEPSLARLVRDSDLHPGETIPVIVRFVEPDAVDGSQAAANAAESNALGTRAICESGGILERAFSHLPLHSARVSREALILLARDSRVAHVSIDHEVLGSLYNTPKAIGAARSGPVRMVSPDLTAPASVWQCWIRVSTRGQT